MATITRQNLIERFLDEMRTASDEPLGWYGSASAITATTIVDAVKFQNSVLGSNQYLGWWAERPTAAAGDQVRPIVSITTTTATHGGANYSDTALLPYRVWRPLWHPNEYIIPLANRALELAWQWWRAPLSMVVNGDGEAATVGGTDSNATVTRNTTAAYVWDGLASVRVLNTAAAGYHQYATMDAANGRAFRVCAYVRTAVGTAVIQLIDVSNGNAVLASAQVTGVGQFQYVQFSGNFPSNCYACAIRVGGLLDAADTYWDDVAAYWEPVTRVSGPSWPTAYHSQDGTEMFRLFRPRNRLVGDGVGVARAYDLEPINRRAYQVLNMPSAANPVEFELGRELTYDSLPIIIEARRNFQDFGALSTDATTSGAPLRLAVAAMKYLAAKERDYPAAKLARYEQDYLAEQRQMSPLLVTPGLDARGPVWQKWG